MSTTVNWMRFDVKWVSDHTSNYKEESILLASHSHQDREETNFIITQCKLYKYGSGELEILGTQR